MGWNTTYICDFCIPLDLLGIMDLKKSGKDQENLLRPYQRPHFNLIEIYNFLPFWPKNSANWRNLALKAIKAKETVIRPNVVKLDFWKFKGQTMVPQHALKSYKVTWRPIGIPFLETTTPEPKMGSASQKLQNFNQKSPWTPMSQLSHMSYSDNGTWNFFR